MTKCCEQVEYAVVRVGSNVAVMAKPHACGTRP